MASGKAGENAGKPTPAKLPKSDNLPKSANLRKPDVLAVSKHYQSQKNKLRVQAQTNDGLDICLNLRVKS